MSGPSALAGGFFVWKRVWYSNEVDERKGRDGMNIHEQIAKELQIKAYQVSQVIALLEDAKTVPFIARYRKEQTGSLDEVQIKAIEDRFAYMNQLADRKQEVLRVIEEQGKLTEDLRKKIEHATVLQRVEDYYRPYKQKKRTKATIAKELGLEPLALEILKWPHSTPEKLAAAFIQGEVESTEQALQGASDILAELISDDPEIRSILRVFYKKQSLIVTKLKKGAVDEKAVFEMYYDYQEAAAKIVPHRTLAINRGEKEDVLRVAVEVDVDRVLAVVSKNWTPAHAHPLLPFMQSVVADAWKRLLHPALERELRNDLTEVAEEQAIHIFAENLKSLLLQPPIKGKMVLGVDPAFRTGCKLAVIDESGKVLKIDAIYPHAPIRKLKEAEEKIAQLLKKFPISLIAIGNGTASRETEQFIVNCLQQTGSEAAYVIVNEAGASVYSASDTARQEFPELQVEQRSAVSIARRLQDPLSELVKIEPKAVGVGQYQHDVSQKKLAESLHFVVETAVNQVGVDVNTASTSLLQYVAGLSRVVAENVVAMRNDNGAFTSRAQLKKVPRLGAKTYEQAIGFLRVPEAKNPLDKTSIHPESYEAAEQISKRAGITVKQIGTKEAEEALSGVNYDDSIGIGKETFHDIVDALKRPLRDPREAYPQPLLKTDVLKLEDLKRGMELQGTVRNVVDFGAFVDIGVKQDGLVHISKLKKGYVKHPLEVVSLGDIVTVWIEDVAVEKGRVALSMVAPNQE